MTDQVYIRPVGFAPGPQHEKGKVIRLAGGMIYAQRFAVILRQDSKITGRWMCDTQTIGEVLAGLPASVSDEAQAQLTNLTLKHPPLELGARTIRLDQPQVMGILNVTPDSFSDGGEFFERPEVGSAHASAMLEAGAAIIDIGGESTRPNAAATWEGDEKERVLPAIEYCAAMGAAISIDTRRAGVLEAALGAGAHMANDVSSMRHDPRSMPLAAKAGCPVILMHAPGDGEDLHSNGEYDSVVFDVFDSLKERRDAAVAAGISRASIVLDPGIGFGKSLADNLAILNALPMYHALGQPLMLGGSRKRMIGALSNEADAHRRLGGSLALAVAAMNAGVQLLRVHDVAETVQARNVWRGLRDAALTDFAELPED